MKNMSLCNIEVRFDNLMLNFKKIFNRRASLNVLENFAEMIERKVVF